MLALRYGQLNLYPGMAIQVMKNLQVRGSWHSTTKFIYKIIAEEIVVRDAHHHRCFLKYRMSSYGVYT